MAKIDIDRLLHRRIIDKYKSLYEDGYFPQAAFESMKQVELALKQKSEKNYSAQDWLIDF